MFTSKSARAFYDPSINSAMPSDVVEITTEQLAELQEGQIAGKVIVWGTDGFPGLVDPPPPSDEDLAKIERAWRDALLTVSDSVVSRHRDEVEAGGITTLTAEQYMELQAYRRALRNWPENGEFPLIDHRPIVPAWLADQVD
jgi:hypothetical protein